MWVLGVRFDDRLKTAIMQPVVDGHDRTVRWRQVIDLLSRLPEDHDEAIADAGFALVEREVPAIPEEARAATARNVAGRVVSFRIAALFARDRLAVAAPVLAAANLSASEWAVISRDCSAEVAAFIHSLSRVSEMPAPSTVALPPAEAAVEAVDDEALPALGEMPSISQMVARIEQLRSRRAADEPLPEQPAPPEPEQATKPAKETPRPPAPKSPSPRRVDRVATGDALFRWESDAAGQIAWVDGVPRGALVGNALVAVAADPAITTALDAREPFDGIEARFDTPAIGGEWSLSAIPAFSPRDGRFLGYRGIARRRDERPVSMPAPAAARPAARAKPRDIEALRETIHEIKTPLNAIIGFAEIIDGQYLGPAHRNYRQRAAGIVAQARILLEAIQDMELAARLQAEQGRGGGVHLGDFMPGLTADLERQADRNGVTLSILQPGRDRRCGLNHEVAERLVKRFLGAVIEAAARGERILVDVAGDEEWCRFGVGRPASTIGTSEAILMDPAYVADGAPDSVLGLGFALRLVRGLARLCDGDVEIEQDKFVLRLPAA